MPSRMGILVWRTIDVREILAAAASPGEIYLPVVERAGSRRATDMRVLRLQSFIGIVDNSSAMQFAGAVIQEAPPQRLV